jgi:hypothetical protein
MSDRERKRAERRKRKQRTTERGAHSGAEEAGSEAEPAATNGGPPLDIAAMAAERGVSKSEVRNQLAREALEPLAEDERPRVVTIGALLSALIATITVGAWALGAEVDGQRPNVVQVFAPALLFGVMARGMWRTRYWAVLGFQAVMAIIMVGSFLTLVSATGLLQVVTPILIGGVAATLFWFTVKALARIQMPDRHLPR